MSVNGHRWQPMPSLDEYKEFLEWVERRDKESKDKATKDVKPNLFLGLTAKQVFTYMFFTSPVIGFITGSTYILAVKLLMKVMSVT